LHEHAGPIVTCSFDSVFRGRFGVSAAPRVTCDLRKRRNVPSPRHETSPPSFLFPGGPITEPLLRASPPSAPPAGPPRGTVHASAAPNCRQPRPPPRARVVRVAGGTARAGSTCVAGRLIWRRHVRRRPTCGTRLARAALPAANGVVVSPPPPLGDQAHRRGNPVD